MTKFLLSIAFASLLVGCERQRSNYAEEASIPQQVEGLNAHGDCNQLVNQNMSILAANRATLVRVCIQLMKEGNLEGIEPESVTSKLLGISQLYQQGGGGDGYFFNSKSQYHAKFVFILRTNSSKGLYFDICLNSYYVQSQQFTIVRIITCVC